MGLVFTGLGSVEELAFVKLAIVDLEGGCVLFDVFVVGLSLEVHKIEPERDNNSEAVTSLPPCDTFSFPMMLPSSNAAVVKRFRARQKHVLCLFYSDSGLKSGYYTGCVSEERSVLEYIRFGYS